MLLLSSSQSLSYVHNIPGQVVNGSGFICGTYFAHKSHMCMSNSFICDIYLQCSAIFVSDIYMAMRCESDAAVVYGLGYLCRSVRSIRIENCCVTYMCNVVAMFVLGHMPVMCNAVYKLLCTVLLSHIS